MKRTLGLGVCICCLIAVTGRSHAAKPVPAPAEMIPDAAVLTIEIPKGKALIESLCESPYWKQAMGLPPVRNAMASPRFKQFRAAVRYVETMLETDWQTGLKKLVGGGVTMAIGPNGGTLLVADSTDEKLLTGLNQILVGFARDEAKKDNNPDRVQSRNYQGVRVWTLGPNEYHAIIGNRLVVANRSEVLKQALALYARSKEGSLAQSPLYQKARRSFTGDPWAKLYVNLQSLKQAPPIQEALTRSRNPLGVLLIGPVLKAVQQADWLTARLDFDGKRLSLTATLPAPDLKQIPFARLDGAGRGAWPNLAVPGRIAAITFYRDLHQFYAAKDDLFPERTAGLIFFENMMGIFFTGRNLTDEVLAETTPEVRFVVAEHQFDPEVGTPAVQFPAFAAVFRMRDPDKFRPLVEEAWQKALGLINFTRGQQALPGLIIDRATHGGVKYTVAYFSAADIKDRKNLDVRFNFRPCLAAVGDCLVLSSAESLTRDLIDALNQEQRRGAQPLTGVDMLLEIDGAHLTRILAANRDNLIRQNMVEKGNTEERARHHIGVLLGLLEQFRQASLKFQQQEGQYRATVSVEVDLHVPSFLKETLAQ